MSISIDIYTYIYTYIYIYIYSGKHFGHGGMPFWHSIGICQVNLKTFHRSAIISSSTESRVLQDPWKVMRDFPVANTGESLVRHTSSLESFLGVEKWTCSPSSSNSTSSQGINSLCHRKSFRKITSTCAHAAQANLSLAGAAKCFETCVQRL